MNIMTPTIHLNGSSAKHLVEQYNEAANKAQELMDAIAAIDLHARDYYIKLGGTADFQQACEESVARYAAAKNIREEMHSIILAIQEQKQERQ